MFVDPGTNIISNKIKSGISLLMGSRKTVTNHEIKDIIKVINSLENREISLKETSTRKIAGQYGRFLNFPIPSLIFGL